VSSMVMYCSFIFYSLFRSFLFTYFFAALPKKMGFKYFGILAGISFLVAGVTQLSMKSVIKYATGTCHLLAFTDTPYTHNEIGDEPDCDKGNWNTIYFVQLICFLSVFILPSIDTFLEKKQLTELKNLFGTPRSISLSEKIARGGGTASRPGSGTFKKTLSYQKPLSPIRAGSHNEEESSEEDVPAF